MMYLAASVLEFMAALQTPENKPKTREILHQSAEELYQKGRGIKTPDIDGE